MKSLYVVQASVDKGRNWFNVIFNGAIAGFEFKSEAKRRMEEAYQSCKEQCQKLHVKTLARKWYRIKEFIEQ